MNINDLNDDQGAAQAACVPLNPEIINIKIKENLCKSKDIYNDCYVYDFETITENKQIKAFAGALLNINFMINENYNIA